MSRFVVLIGAAALIAFCAVPIGISAFSQEDDGVVTDENVESQQLESVPLVPENPSHGAILSGGIPSLRSVNFLYVSTMDGKLHALDAMNGGKEVWLADFDSEPLLLGTLSRMQPMKANGRMFNLIPALDGTLYIYSYDERILEPVPISTDLLLQASIRVGYDAVAGGRTISTTGVDPLTGEVRYHCTSSHCESVPTESVTSTLVFRRSTSKVRAVNALSGDERWNLSVSEYDVTLATVNRDDLYPQGAGIRYLLQPPNGIVTAFDSCGNELWSHKLDSHIARTWSLEGGELKEVSLFNTNNIHTLHLTNGRSVNGVDNSDSLFYIGTVNHEPFIIHSTLVKNEMKRIARNTDLDELHSATGQLSRLSSSSYFVEHNTVDELLFSSYKRPVTAEQVTGASKQVSVRKGDEFQLVGTDDDRGGLISVSCPYSGQTSLIREEDLRKAAFTTENCDQGWFVLRPNPNSKNRDFNGFLDSNQCSANIVERVSRTFQVDQMVSGWWRIVALVMLSLAGCAAIVMHALLRRRKELQSSVPSSLSTSKSSLVEQLKKVRKAETRSTSAGPSLGGSPLLSTPSSEKVLQRKISSTRESAGDTFHSKFIQDFEPVKLLGCGGFGVVFEARNRLDECPYAVKRIAVANSEHAIQLVLREVRAMAKLDHPGIIRYYHTWIERPPQGWQEEQDCLMLRGMDLKSDIGAALSALEIVRSDVPPTIPSVASQIDLSSSENVAPVMLSDQSSDGSWLDDSKNGKAENSESSSDSELSVSRGQQQQTLSENSDSVIFVAGDCSEVGVASNDDLSQLGKKMVLVSSTDEDLIPSSDTSNFVYLYIQMQLCQEQTLHAWLSNHISWEDRPLEKMKVWMVQMCSAVSYIHRQGLIHRDIKPQNIFFAPDQTLKVGDLGLVTRCIPAEDQPVEKSASRFMIHTDNVGTRGYMSPEQLENKPYTFKVDVFSLGLIFCELVIPFQTLMERSVTLRSLQQGLIPDALSSMPSEVKNFTFVTVSSSCENR
ncbi:hypothetical protein KIN20_030050 [Parelaphostrongylus tenuis]|uniref:PRKR-like endoplasmic reticulum kinase n=1 Tax=Parelaphostrongylus tenuis TaxID=148309 RepID=A0AAD5R461_PARTN|nr:hypothetical protein KIN20_030050 [Parelaphostrongylus tenuis]